MTLYRINRLLLLGLCLLPACKKTVDFPPELRPRDFYVRATLVSSDGQERPYEYRGEDTVSVFTNAVVNIEYLSDSKIQDSLRYIWAGLGYSILPMPFFVQFSHPQPITDPFTPPEWREADFAGFLYPGKIFQFGSAPGEAYIRIADFPKGAWAFSTSNVDNSGAYLRVLEVDDYGIPDLGTPYFGKKVRFEFSCKLTNSAGESWELRHGEAVLLFRYYKF